MARRIAASLPAVVMSAAIAAGAAMPAAAQDQGVSLEPLTDFWDIELGAHISEQPDAFQEYACGTNGGPPSLALTGFADFMTCPPEETGLHEVQFRYDDMVQYWALAHRIDAIAERYNGTRVFSFPAIVSVLIDDEGIVRGQRVVTDNRVSTSRRGLAYALADAVQTRFGSEEGWQCVDLPPAEGEEPFGTQFIKQDCRKTTEEGLTVLTSSRLLRKPGQTYLDPITNEVRTGYFESIGRAEIYDETVDLADVP